MKAIKNGFSVTHFVLDDLMHVLRADAAIPPARLRAKRYFNCAVLIIDLCGATGYVEWDRGGLRHTKELTAAYFGPFRSLISLQAVHPFRCKPFSRFGPSRSLISVHAVQA